MMMRTAIDEARDAADYVILYMDDGIATVSAQNGAPAIKGRGMKRDYQNGTFLITTKRLADLRAEFSVSPAF
jgi:hypothetical protein